MKKIFYLSFLISLNINLAYSQELKIGFETGYGRYAMASLKLQNEALIYYYSMPYFETKILTEYPMKVYYRPSIFLKVKRFEIGLVYSFCSTRSKIVVKYDTNEFFYNDFVNANFPGILLGFDLFERRKLKFSIYSLMGIANSTLVSKNYFYRKDTLVDYHESKNVSQNYFTEPGLKCSYPVYVFNLHLNLGYCIQFGDQEFYTYCKPGWNGFRFGISANYSIGTFGKGSRILKMMSGLDTLNDKLSINNFNE